MTRARKDGVIVLKYDRSSRTAGRDQQLAAISAAWLADKGGPELGFTLGRFDLDRLDDQEVFVAVVGAGGPQERVVGFVTWLPYANGAAAVLDLMRRGEDCPPGVMETLVVDSLADFAARGRAVASLGGVPLAATSERTDRTSQLMGWLYEHGDAVYAAKGLFRFKDKFDPRWEPMFLAYPGAADAPRIGVAALLRAFLPPGAVRELLAAHRPDRRAFLQRHPRRPPGHDGRSDPWPTGRAGVRRGSAAHDCRPAVGAAAPPDRPRLVRQHRSRRSAGASAAQPALEPFVLPDLSGPRARGGSPDPQRSPARWG